MTVRILALDTAHPSGFIALGEDGVIVAKESLGGRATEEVGGKLHTLLATCGWRASDLDLIGVGVGPGSYTGMRVSIGLAQGLFLGSGLPILGLPSLMAYPWLSGGDQNPKKFLSLFDARAGGVYVVPGEQTPSHSITWGEPQGWSLDELKGHLSDYAAVITPDLETMRQRLSLTGQTVWIGSEPNIAYWMQQVFSQRESASKAGFIAPLYLRKTAAERNLGLEP